MIKNVKCPECKAANSLPIEPMIHPTKGFIIEVWACSNCGIEMDGKEYIKRLESINPCN